MSEAEIDSTSPGTPDVSRAVLKDWTCDCGQEVRAREWLIIDCINRPELVDMLRKSDLNPKCPVCGEAATSRLPFAVARLAKSVPLLLLKEQPDSDLPPILVERLEEAYEQLRKEGEYFPRMVAPIASLHEILERSIDKDLQNLGSSPTGREDRYERFLIMVQAAYDRNKGIQIVMELTGVRDTVEASSLFKQRPELLDSQTFDLLNEFASSDSLLAGLHTIQKRFLHQAQEDLEKASRSYIEERADFFEQLYGPAEDLRQQVESLAATGCWEEVLAHAKEGLDFARITHNDYLIAEFSYNAGSAICNSTLKTSQDLEQARAYLEESLQTEAGRANPQVHLQLSTVYGSRSIGDPYENFERSIALAEEGLRLLNPEEQPELWAMAKTNLALQYFGREAGNRLENLKRARELCEEALQVRSPEKNVDDWAYTMINLGVIDIDLLQITGDESIKPLEKFEAVIEREAMISRPELKGRSHYNIGKFQLDTAKEASKASAIGLIADAKQHFAISLIEHKNDPLLLAETHARIAELAQLEGDQDEEEKQFVSALSYVSPEEYPEKYEAIASGAASRAADARDWPKAATRYELALKAARIRYDARKNEQRREGTLRTTAYLSRWTAAAIARCGDTEHAAEVLEEGKALSLGMRAAQDEVDLQLLRDLSPQLADEYELALNGVSSSRGQKAISKAREDLNDVIARIRAFEGMAGFLQRTPSLDIAEAVKPGHPLVYLNPTPHGTLVLIVEISEAASQSLQFAAHFLETTSKEIIETLVMSPSGSYFLNIVGNKTDAAAIEKGLHYIGNKLMRHVAALCKQKEFSQITILTSGPLSMVPVHTAQWQENGVSRCLADLYSITYSPSAHLASSCQQKWKARANRAFVFVGVADPNRSNRLHFSQVEVGEISSLFPAGSVHVRNQQGATVEFLENFAPRATHLHLACHGKSEPFDYRNSVIELANGEITVEEMIRRGSLESQIAVASACQTAVLDQMIAEEGLSMGAALLAAGSSAAIATCWPVDDFPTALLMVRFYELLLAKDNLRVAEALGQAQTWLRELRQADLVQFLDKHPTFGTQIPSYAGETPFASPYYWGAFLAMGG